MMAQRRSRFPLFALNSRLLCLSFIIVCLSLLLGSMGNGGKGGIRPAAAQASPRYEVYLSRIASGASLYFLDVRTGLSTVVPANGEGHTPLRDGVLFRAVEGVKIAYPDGRVGLLSAIPPSSSAETVQLVTASNGAWMAWSVTARRGLNTVSEVFMADARGENQRSILFASSPEGVGIIPLALSDGGESLVYARVSDPTAALPLLPTYGTAFRLDTASGQSTTLPEAAECPCAVGVSADGRWFGRLVPTSEGIELRLWDVISGAAAVVPSGGRGDRAGNLLLTMAAGKALYLSGRALANGRIEYTLMLADLGTQSARPLSNEFRGIIRPLTLSADGESAILVGVERDGTFKVTLSDGAVTTVSEAVYLGTVSD